MLQHKRENGHGNNDILDLILSMREGKELQSEAQDYGSKNGVILYLYYF